MLMLTAKDGEYEETDAFDLGADDYLTKPFSFRVLVARLRALARRGAPERPVILTAGTLSLDPTRRSGAARRIPDHTDAARVRVAGLPHAEERRRHHQGGDTAQRVG